MSPAITSAIRVPSLGPPSSTVVAVVTVVVVD
jgi:hypothetical protein